MYWKNTEKQQFEYKKMAFYFQSKPLSLYLYKIKLQPVDVYLFIISLTLLTGLYYLVKEEKDGKSKPE